MIIWDLDYNMKSMIGLVTIDNPEMLQESLDTLKSTIPQDTKVVVVNNGGKLQKPKDIIKGFGFELIDLEQRISLAGAWNIFLKMDYSYTVISNDDILYSEGWFTNLIDAMEKNLDSGIIQPYNTLSSKPENFPNNYQLENRVGDIPGDNFRGCCFGVSKLSKNTMAQYEEQFEAEKYKGLFDEDLYPFGSEDQDYYIRMNKAGFKFSTCFNSYIHHYTGKTMNMLYSPNEFASIVTRNAEAVHLKHSKRGDLWTDTKTS